MKKIGNILTAYIIASLMVIVGAWVGEGVFEAVAGVRVTTSLFVASVWLLLVGCPSGFTAAGYLIKLLGGRRSWSGAWLGQAGSRMIPVGTQLTYNTPLVIKGSGPPTQIQIKQLEIRSGAYVITHEALENFLRTVWNRQKRGEDGLSRTWWVEKGRQLERGEYEAILEVLIQEGLITGRTQGRSGKLLMPPMSSLHHLQDRV